MSERSWNLSIDAEQDPKMHLLSDLVGKVVRGNSEILAGQLSNNPIQFTTHFDDEGIEAALDEHAMSDFYNDLSFEEKKKVTRILNLSDEAMWRYGSRRYIDGLWEADGHVSEIPFERRDALVLTGAVGVELIGMNKRLDRLAGAIEPNVLRRAVLLGGVALAEGAKRSVEDNESYIGPNHQGLRAETQVGGTIHGDFWTSRRMRFQEEVTDPTGEKQVFGPSFETVYVPAYHSTETRIMSALLGYQVAYQGVDRKRLFSHLVEKAGIVAKKAAGAFGDFGDDDGHEGAGSLEHHIKNGVKEGDILANLVVYPQRPDRFVMTARRDGVEFAHGEWDNAMDELHTHASFIVPAEEIEDYVIALLGSGYGRTSQSALSTIIMTLQHGAPASTY